jgi:hypothetical protein
MLVASRNPRAVKELRREDTGNGFREEVKK